MGPRSAVLRASFFEVLCEPLSLLLTLGALALMVVGAVFHCHNFGESARLVCELGLSAQMIGGIAIGVSAAARTFGREEASGTLAMTLAHPLSRGGFFLAKCAGVWAGAGLLMWTIYCLTVALARGGLAGHALAAHTGDVPRIWGPLVAVAVGAPLAALCWGAIWNRLTRGRFVCTALVALAALSSASLLLPWSDWRLAGELLASSVLLLFPTAVFIVLAAAATVRLGERAAVALALGVFVSTLPLLGNYYPSARVLREGFAWRDGLCAAFAALPLLAGLGALGVYFLDRKDIG